MRTTVTLDADVERLLRDSMRRTGKRFKQALNDAIRQGLAEVPIEGNQSKFVVRSRPMNLRRGIDPNALANLDADLEADDRKAKTEALRERIGRSS